MMNFTSTLQACLRLFLCLAAVFCACSNSAWAGPESTAADFLKIGAGARAVAMGEAQVAVADDAYAIYWNPAGINQLRERQLAFTHNKWFQDISHDYMSFVLPQSQYQSIGFSITHLNITGIERRTGDTTEPDDTMKASDSALSFAYARDLYHNVTLGSNIKYISQTLGDDSATAVALDLGGIYQIPLGELFYPSRQDMRLGFSVRNFGTKVKFKDEGYPLPLAYRVGVAYKIVLPSFFPLYNFRLPYERSNSSDVLLIACDMNKAVDNDYRGNLGLEYLIRERYALRTGYKFGYDMDKASSSSFGLGVRHRQVGFDYAFVPYGVLGETHRVSISVDF